MIVAFAIAWIVAALSGGGGSRGHYEYSAEDMRSYNTVLLLPQARRQPRIIWADPLRDYMISHGVDCPNFVDDVSFGSTDPWGGECWRDDGKRDLYYLKTFKDSEEKLDYLQGSASGCELPLDHEYWVEGPNWFIEVHDLDQADPKIGESSTHDLAVGLSHALGARLYRAC